MSLVLGLISLETDVLPRTLLPSTSPDWPRSNDRTGPRKPYNTSNSITHSHLPLPRLPPLRLLLDSFLLGGGLGDLWLVLLSVNGLYTFRFSSRSLLAVSSPTRCFSRGASSRA